MRKKVKRFLLALGIDPKLAREEQGTILIRCTALTQGDLDRCFKADEILHDGVLRIERSSNEEEAVIEAFVDAASFAIVTHEFEIREINLDCNRALNEPAFGAALAKIRADTRPITQLVQSVAVGA